MGRVSEPPVKKCQGKKPAEDGLAKQYHEIGIRAVAAAVKSRNQNVGRKNATRGRKNNRRATNE
jgi:hypothetical protein